MRTMLSSRPFVLALVVVLLLAVPALAAGDAGHGEKKDGLAFTGLKRYDLGIYTIVVFCLLVLIVTKVAWPKIREGLEKREANIRGAIEEARKDRDEARVTLEQVRKQIAEAALQAKAVLDEARRDADVLRAEQREVGVREAAAERERARREIESAKAGALKDIYEQAVKLAAMMSEKALRRAVTAEDHRRLLDETLADMKAGGKA